MPLRIDLLRADDLLSLQIEAVNLELSIGNPANPCLLRSDPNADAFLVVVFPPQAIAEEAFYEQSAISPPRGESERGKKVSPDPLKPPGLVLSRMAGASRLAFRVPADVISIPYTITGLTDWSRLEPSLSPIAAAGSPPQFGPDEPPPIRPLLDTETGLELPFRLLISPDAVAVWRGAAAPVTSFGRTELWHTRLVVPRSTSDPPEPPMVELDETHTASFRAIWSPDYRPSPSPPPTHDVDDSPFLSSLSPRDRHFLVRLMSDFTHVDANGTGQPAEANRLMLSALGGWLDARGAWLGPSDIDLIEWRHLATMARDHYVRVVYRGRLFPLKHRASLVKITERRIEAAPMGTALAGMPKAYLRQFMYVVPRDRELSYAEEPYAHDGREMLLSPLLRINTLRTPKIDPPSYITGEGGSFWIEVGGNKFPFSVTGIDIAGNRVTFTMPLIFVPDSDNPGALTDVHKVYLAGPRRAEVPNQRITFAPPDPSSDTTTLLTSGLVFDAELERGDGGFLPFLDTADVRVQAIEHVAGREASTTIRLFSDYLANDLDPHAGVFAEIVGAAMPLQFTSQQAGGITQPNLGVTGLARASGPVAGTLKNAASGILQPEDFFKDFSPTLFGVLPIDKIVDAAAGFAAAAPQIKTVAKPDLTNPTEIATTLHWSIKPRPFSPPGLDFTPDTAPPGSALTIDVIVTKPVSQPAAPGIVSVKGSLTKFRITVASSITIHFDAFTFASATGQKTKVDVQLSQEDPIIFTGPLEFIKKLTEIIPPGIFGQNGPKIAVQRTEIEVGFSIGVPPLTLGVFSVTNIAISTSLALPFISGKPTIGFAFSERHRPFLLTVSLLGGGGFFHVELDTERIVLVEAQLEFGGEFALDIGVASGSVHVMAGIYFALKAGSTELSGFVDLGGEVSVLGLISVSVEFNLSLSYDVQLKIARGTATLTIAVSIAFFSQSVSLTVERSFSAGSDHISIGQLMNPDDWLAYAQAFA